MRDTADAADMPATGGFRASMNWLHTWGGVVIGGVLFAIFWMGSLAVFDREIDRWTMPMTRIAQTEFRSLDALVPIAHRMAAGADQWAAILPTPRVPTMQFRVYDEAKHIDIRRDIDPASGVLLADPGTFGGTGFFYPFHWGLQLRWWRLGEWIVGLAAMSMLVMCISGVAIHKKIFVDFFTLRIVRKPQRTTLDVHNIAGVFGLPFNFVIALSGLVIFMGVYMPMAQQIPYGGDRDAFGTEAYGRFDRARSGRPATLASLDAMQAEAMRRWNGERPFLIRVTNPGDVAAYVELRRPYDRAVTMRSEAIYFDGPTGRILKATGTAPVLTVQRFISGIHFIQFRHWTLRWLYFLGGLAGCVLIATGFLFWVQSRRKSHARLGLRGTQIVEGLSIGATTGIVIATLGFLIANRLLPLGIDGRDHVEMWAFYIVWVASFAHAWLRPGRAWIEQSWAIAAGGGGAALLNAVTTGDSIFASAARGQWGVAGVDGVLIVGAAIAAMAAIGLSSRRPAHAALPVHRTMAAE